jgi:hypothetical protein
MDVGFVLCRWVLDSKDLEQQDVTARVEELKQKGECRGRG